MKASQILRESQSKRKQHFGSYVRLNGGKVEAYCALGALGCEVKAINKDGSYNELYSSISKVFGINTELKFEERISEYDNINCTVKKGKPRPTCSHDNNMFHFIAHLNDEHKLTFEEIAEILEQYGL